MPNVMNAKMSDIMVIAQSHGWWLCSESSEKRAPEPVDIVASKNQITYTYFICARSEEVKMVAAAKLCSRTTLLGGVIHIDTVAATCMVRAPKPLMRETFRFESFAGFYQGIGMILPAN